MQRRTPFLFSLISAIGLSACSVSTPFQGQVFTEANEKTVYVGITHATLRNDLQSRSLFFDYVKEVEDSLPQNPGFLGFSKRLALFGNDAWTMSVWDDQTSMEAFVRSEPHQRAIRNAMASLTSARFARIEIEAAEAPLTWDEALKVLESDSRSY